MEKDDEEGTFAHSDEELLETEHVTEEGAVSKFEHLFAGMNRSDITQIRRSVHRDKPFLNEIQNGSTYIKRVYY